MRAGARRRAVIDAVTRAVTAIRRGAISKARH